MKAYCFNEDGIYTGEADVGLLPGSLKPALPVASTLIEPPVFNEGTQAKWDGAKWSVITDTAAVERKRGERLSLTDANGIPLFYLDLNGDIKPKTKDQLAFDLNEKMKKRKLADVSISLHEKLWDCIEACLADDAAAKANLLLFVRDMKKKMKEQEPAT